MIYREPLSVRDKRRPQREKVRSEILRGEKERYMGVENEIFKSKIFETTE